MSAGAPETVLGVFVIFCRIGGCLMVASGFSSSRFPPRVRLLLAVSVTLAVVPLVLPTFSGRLTAEDPASFLWWIGCETLNGLTIGLFGRVALFALDTLMNFAAVAVGFGAIPGTSVTEDEASPALGSLVMMVATVLIFVSGLHWEILRGLLASYDRIPAGEPFGTRLALAQFVDHGTAAFVLAVRLASPFIVYSVVVNLALGLANKLSPQIPVFFIATPFVMAGGLLVLLYLSSDFFAEFIRDFATSLRLG